MNKEKEEKIILEKLEKDKNEGFFNEIFKDYKQLITLNPHKEHYWDDCLDFLYFYYQYTISDDWVNILQSGISISESARKYLLLPQESSKYFLYEYRFIVELIRLDGSYSQEYSDEKLMELLDAAIVADPQNSAAIQEKGNLYQANGDYRNAEVEYLCAVKLRESNTLLSDMALNYELLEDNNKAIPIYLKLYENMEEISLKAIFLQALIRIYKREGNEEKSEYYTNLLEDLT